MTKYAIIAGNGDLPKIIAEKLGNAKVIGFASDKPKIKTDLLTNFGSVGTILEFLKKHQIKKIVFAGGISRPNLKQIKPDKEGAKLLARITVSKFFASKGDDSILSKITTYLEEKGFEIVPAEKVLSSLKTKKGVLGRISPNKQQLEDIKTAFAAAKNIGKSDIGQAVIAEDGLVLAVEAAEGTEALISRAGKLQKSYGGVLVKCSKPKQDKRIDLPAIGVMTIKQLKQAGICGVGVEAGKSIIIDFDKVIKAADEAGLFIFGI